MSRLDMRSKAAKEDVPGVHVHFRVRIHVLR
jgi:hypothetical protein